MVTLEEVSTMPLFSDVQVDGFSYSPLAHLTLLLFGIYCFWGNGPYLSLGLLPLQTQSSFIKSNHILSKHKDIHNAPREKKYWTIKCKSWIRAFSPGETKKKKRKETMIITCMISSMVEALQKAMGYSPLTNIYWVPDIDQVKFQHRQCGSKQKCFYMDTEEVSEFGNQRRHPSGRHM